MIWNKAMAFDPKNYCTDPTHIPHDGSLEGPFGAHEHLAMPDQVDDHLIVGIRQFDPESVIAVGPLPRMSTKFRRAAP